MILPAGQARAMGTKFGYRPEDPCGAQMFSQAPGRQGFWRTWVYACGTAICGHQSDEEAVAEHVNVDCKLVYFKTFTFIARLLAKSDAMQF